MPIAYARDHAPGIGDFGRSAEHMPETESDPNSEALTKAIQVVGPKSLILGLIILISVVAICLICGSSAASRQGTPGWGSLFFMIGGIQSLVVAVPIAVCVYVILTLISGLIAFLYFRFSRR